MHPISNDLDLMRTFYSPFYIKLIQFHLICQILQ